MTVRLQKGFFFEPTELVCVIFKFMWTTPGEHMSSVQNEGKSCKGTFTVPKSKLEAAYKEMQLSIPIGDLEAELAPNALEGDSIATLSTLV